MISLVCLVLVCFSLFIVGGKASVVIVTPNNGSFSFPNTEAIFAPRVPVAGVLGVLYAASPSDACQPLNNDPVSLQHPLLSFVIVKRGSCPFDTKAREAQSAGFDAIIVHNDRITHDLITMSGKARGIWIPAVFVSKETGEILLKYIGKISIKCYILPVLETATWSILAVSLISLLAIIAVLSTFFFVRHHRIQGVGPQLRRATGPLGMSFRAVKALPSLLFKLGVSNAVTSETCAICLEDYEMGDKLRVLPCHHEFHSSCIDRWLVLMRSFCPKCKRDVHVESAAIAASECTPLLAAVPRFQWSIVTSRHIPIETSSTGSYLRAFSGVLSFSSATRLPSPGSLTSLSHSLASSCSSSATIPISLSRHFSHSAISVSCMHQSGSLSS